MSSEKIIGLIVLVLATSFTIHIVVSGCRSALYHIAMFKIRLSFYRHMEEVFARFGNPAHFAALSGGSLQYCEKSEVFKALFEIARKKEIRTTVYRDNVRVCPWYNTLQETMENFSKIEEAYKKYRDEDSSVADKSNSKYSDWLENLTLVFE